MCVCVCGGGGKLGKGVVKRGYGNYVKNRISRENLNN